jgi:hypothetical protein
VELTAERTRTDVGSAFCILPPSGPRAYSPFDNLGGVKSVAHFVGYSETRLQAEADTREKGTPETARAG